jgi:hypothetical protein
MRIRKRLQRHYAYLTILHRNELGKRLDNYRYPNLFMPNALYH